MMAIGSIMATVVPGTFVPDMDASEAPTISAIPGTVTPPVSGNGASALGDAVQSVLGAVHAVSKTSPDGSHDTAQATVAPSVSGETSFKDTVKHLLSDVNDAINTSDENTRDLATGKTNDVNKVVTSVEEANLALEYTLAIRTKLMQAYQAVQQMSV
jgi:flagellar hook-basal body complex protein FliE